jgi:shikimate kinase
VPEKAAPEPASLPGRIVLVGFMGAGKSTIGKKLARRLEYRFEDIDRRIEARTGRRVAAIFQEDGEPAFRKLELEEARAVGSLTAVVVAAGGGAFAQEATRKALQEGALTVWLQCSLEAALRRVPTDGSRPLAGNREIMQALLAEREPSYRRADVAVDTSRRTPREVVERIVALLSGREEEGPSVRP